MTFLPSDLPVGQRLIPVWLCFASLLLAGCPGPSNADGGGDLDGGLPGDGDADAGPPPDAGSADAGGSFEDAGAVDGGSPSPAPGFGVLSGECWVLDDELTAVEPAIFVNAFDFGADPYDEEDYDLLTPGGQEIIDDGNAGGSSLLSEVFAYEALYRCEGATLLKTETEVLYTNPMGKITDLLVEIDGFKIGVSVTRAVAFPFDDPYTVAQAQAILEQKLQGVLDSTANMHPDDAWQKQILAVIAYSPGHADALREAFMLVSADLLADTVVMVTVSNGDDAFLY